MSNERGERKRERGDRRGEERENIYLRFDANRQQRKPTTSDVSGPCSPCVRNGRRGRRVRARAWVASMSPALLCSHVYCVEIGTPGVRGSVGKSQRRYCMEIGTPACAAACIGPVPRTQVTSDE